MSPLKELNCKGQGMLEAIVGSGLLMLFLSLLGATFYFSLVHAGMNYLLHEHLVCEATAHHGDCRSDFMMKTKSLLIFGKIQHFDSGVKNSELQARVDVQLPLHQTLRIEKVLAL